VPHRDADQRLDQRARIDAPGGVVRVVEDHGGDATPREQQIELLGIGLEPRRVRGQLDDPLARPRDEPVVLPARARHDDARSVGPQDLQHHRQAATRTRGEEHLVGQESHSRGGIVELSVAVDELRDGRAYFHASHRRAIAVNGVARDALRPAHDLGMRREVRILVVALGEIQRALLLDAPCKHAHQGFGRRE
jgi:hypothetical protein